MEYIMYNAIISDVRTSLNLNSDEKVLIVTETEWTSPDYSSMSLDELLGEDSMPTYTTPTMEEVRVERARKDALNTVLDLQDRMCKGMVMIQAMQRKGHAYGMAKDAFNKAKEIMFADKTRKPQSWWTRFNTLKVERNQAWAEFSAAGGGAQMSKLWKHWMSLKDECQSVAIQHEGLWSEYFGLLNGELTQYFTHAGDVQDQAVDSRHMDLDVALRLSHMEEEEGNRSIENMPFTIPVRTGGYVPVCKDVTHLYMSKEEIASQMANCPF